MASFCQYPSFTIGHYVYRIIDPQLAKEQGEKAMADPAGLMQNDDDNMKQTPKYSYITGGNENIYTLLYNWSANVVLIQRKEMERAYKEQSTILDPRCEYCGGDRPLLRT